MRHNSEELPARHQLRSAKYCWGTDLPVCTLNSKVSIGVGLRSVSPSERKSSRAQTVKKWGLDYNGMKTTYMTPCQVLAGHSPPLSMSFGRWTTGSGPRPLLIRTKAHPLRYREMFLDNSTVMQLTLPREVPKPQRYDRGPSRL